MAWCPACGAEYREGVSQCAKCGVALVEQRPVVPGPRLPPLVARRVDEVAAAFGYAAEAVRVLRRHPSLLLLPLGLAVFNEAESAAGSYVMLRHTAAGRQLVEQVHNLPPAPSRRVRVEVRLHEGPPVLHVDLGGAASVVAALALGAEEGGGSRGVSAAGSRRMWWAVSVLSLLVAGLSAFVAAGYYGVARGAVSTSMLEWGRFWPCARRFVGRMWVFLVVLGLPSWVGVSVLALAPRGTAIAPIAIAIWEWVLAALVFVLALTPFVIVVDDARLGTAMKRSVVVVIRCLTIAVVLILGSLVVAEALRWPFDWIRSSALGRTWPTLLTPADWPAMGVGLLQRCVGALLAAFFPLAMLAWYGRVSESAAAAGSG